MGKRDLPKGSRLGHGHIFQANPEYQCCITYIPLCYVHDTSTYETNKSTIVMVITTQLRIYLLQTYNLQVLPNMEFINENIKA